MATIPCGSGPGLERIDQSGFSGWPFIATVAVVERVSGLVFGVDERPKGGGRQGFWLARPMPGGWSVRALAGRAPAAIGPRAGCPNSRE